MTGKSEQKTMQHKTIMEKALKLIVILIVIYLKSKKKNILSKILYPDIVAKLHLSLFI